MAFLPAYSVAALLVRVSAADFALAIHAAFALIRVAAGAVAAFFVFFAYPFIFTIFAAFMRSLVIAFATTAVLVRVIAADWAAAIYAAFAVVRVVLQLLFELLIGRFNDILPVIDSVVHFGTYRKLDIKLFIRKALVHHDFAEGLVHAFVLFIRAADDTAAGKP